MTNIKCKMCGGDIQRAEDQAYGTCDSCGSTMTFPRVSDEQRANLFNRANHFRRQGEFDKAIAAYESILNGDDADAEAHWGVVLSRYGIEYVEDPASGERVPTCHRVQMNSILNDADYLAALEHSPDSYSRSLYEEEAKRIAEIQRGILALSSQEKPYDVFICYKETTDGGSRTPDSALAQDVYYQMVQEGYKVFFSRITLEDKLGQRYEPYIFAALNSAKVMVVIGTQAEYFNAVWVKNEWSRFLALMKKDRSKLLIPCYKGMDAYDLPEALSILQSQDMGKIGFIQDLVRGIKKVVDAGRVKDTENTPKTVETIVAPGVHSLLTRAHMFLEDGDFKSAAEYVDRVLDIDPKYAPAYMARLQAGLQIRNEDDLGGAISPLEQYTDYQKAVRFAEVRLKQVYVGYNQRILDRLDKERREAAMDQAFIRNCCVGNKVAYGAYKQDKYASNRKEAIQWRVLERDGSKVLLISDKNLDCQPFHRQNKTVNWEFCDLRKWLNDIFLSTAFTDMQQKAIVKNTLSNTGSGFFRNQEIKPTIDKIFLLSVNEAENLFNSDADRVAKNTDYAKAHGAYDMDGAGWWWLRSPGRNGALTALVLADGSVHWSGNLVDRDNNAVRPAMWLNLESGIFSTEAP